MNFLNKLLLRLMGVRRDKLQRKPFVVIRRCQDDRWTIEDRKWLEQMVQTPVWEKLMRRSDIDISGDVLGDGSEIGDVDYIRALVAGRLRERSFIARHSGVPDKAGVDNPERLGYFTNNEELVEDEERSFIQEDSGDLS